MFSCGLQAKKKIASEVIIFYTLNVTFDPLCFAIVYFGSLSFKIFTLVLYVFKMYHFGPFSFEKLVLCLLLNLKKDQNDTFQKLQGP